MFPSREVSVKKTVFTAVVLLLLSGGGYAELIYKSVDAQGRVTYAFDPLPGAEHVEVLDIEVPLRSPDATTDTNLVEQMAAVTDRIKQDRQQREAAQLERDKLRLASQQQVLPPVIYREDNYYYPPHAFGFPHQRHHRHQRFPDVRKVHHPKLRREERDDSRRPSGVLVPRSKLLTP